MEDLAFKIKLGVLWLILEVAYLTYGMVELEALALGAIEGIQGTPDELLLLAVILLVPYMMAVLSLTLKGSANRWTNIIVGLVFIVLSIIGLIELAVEPWAILITLTEFVPLALIVWYAWKWPKQEV
jgi:hypothetical protein